MKKRKPWSKGQSNTLLFYVRDKVALDNLAPVIWSFSEVNYKSIVLVTDPDLYSQVKNSWWYPACRNVVTPRMFIVRATTGLPEKLSRIRWSRWRLKRFVARNNVKVVVIDWGEGVPTPERSFFIRTYRWWFSDMSTQLQVAAANRSVPTVALPHGHSTPTSLIESEHVREVMHSNGGKLPFADRNSFTQYVFESEYHRDVIVNNSTMSGKNTQVWGSARFNDYWVKLLYDATTTASLTRASESQKRTVLFFTPKWFNLIDKEATLKLVISLASEKTIRLVVRGHARTHDAVLTKADKALVERLGSVTFVQDNTSSPSLIKACDVLVDVDSSIAFDAVLLNKPYVRPRYLQDASVSTIWDTLGGAHQTDSLADTVALLTKDILLPAPRDPQFEQVVFGGAGVDVLRRYRDGLLAIAASE